MWLLRASLVATLLVAMGGLAWAQQRKLSADDYVEIQQLYARYNNAIDSGDAEGYAATFTPDGVFNNFNGHDALVGFIKAWREKMGCANRRHWNTNLLITPTAEGASGSTWTRTTGSLASTCPQRPAVMRQRGSRHIGNIVGPSGMAISPVTRKP